MYPIGPKLLKPFSLRTTFCVAENLPSVLLTSAERERERERLRLRFNKVSSERIGSRCYSYNVAISVYLEESLQVDVNIQPFGDGWIHACSFCRLGARKI